MVKMYLHSSKEGNYEEGQDEFGLQGQALENFRCALYEVEFDVELDMESGETIIKKVNNRELMQEN